MSSYFEHIARIALDSRVIYFRCDPPIQDFTKKYEGSYIISNEKETVEYPADSSSFQQLFASLRRTIFDKDHIVFTWDIKRFMSYAQKFKRRPLRPLEGHVIDLKYGSEYLGLLRKSPPESFLEALTASNEIVSNEKWKKISQVVHMPLALEVLPVMETRGVFGSDPSKVLYSSYEIEGSVNGRMTTPKPGKDFLTVHAMKLSDKVCLRPRRADERETHIFIEIDFTNMEVAMLQWLSEDEDLKAALEGPTDFYESLLEVDCTPDQKRKLGKSFFLPVVYGLKAAGLAKRLKVEESVADTLISGLNERFPASFQWLDDKEAELAEDSIATDYLGRKRDFSNEPPYLRRNFEVQSVAATVCLEKLCQLYKALPDHVLFHIHDGYFLTCRLGDAPRVMRIACQVLESESGICPGLRLRTKCQAGPTLLEMITLRG